MANQLLLFFCYIAFCFPFLLTGRKQAAGSPRCPETSPQIEYTEIDVKGRGPMELWEHWNLEAKATPENSSPDTMSMSTVRRKGFPAARTLLLRGYNPSGFKIYTDYRSPKAKELERNNRTALVFFWVFAPPGESSATGQRQVRVEGHATKLSRQESLEYFYSLPPGEQVRAVVQRQSRCIGELRQQEILITTRKLLALSQCPGYKLPYPEKWGGYLIEPRMMEFYQKDPNSIGDRIKFRKLSDLNHKSKKPCRRYKSIEGWVYERLEV